MRRQDEKPVRRHDRRSRRYFLAAAWVIAAMLAVSCAPKKEDQGESGTAMPEEATPPPATPSPGPPSGEFSVDGTILKLPEEGTCWVIRTLEGTQYEPTNLANDFRAEGTRVRALLRARSDMASACGVGTVVEIANIERLE
jgi:hypothetical protein